MKPAIIFLILSALPIVGIGQNTFHASVVNELGDEIPFARVVLRGPDGSVDSTLTSFEGEFQFEELKAGAYQLDLDFIGFKSLKVFDLIIPDSVSERYFVLQELTFPEVVVDYSLGSALIEDSLGNTWCVNLSKNQSDSLGRKQGVWVDYFMDYSDQESGFSIGQKLAEGTYLDDKKHGIWTFFNSEGEIDRVEEYEYGELIQP